MLSHSAPSKLEPPLTKQDDINAANLDQWLAMDTISFMISIFCCIILVHGLQNG